jgi:hypothetical protein
VDTVSPSPPGPSSPVWVPMYWRGTLSTCHVHTRQACPVSWEDLAEKRGGARSASPIRQGIAASGCQLELNWESPGPGCPPGPVCRELIIGRRFGSLAFKFGPRSGKGALSNATGSGGFGAGLTRIWRRLRVSVGGRGPRRGALLMPGSLRPGPLGGRGLALPGEAGLQGHSGLKGTVPTTDPATRSRDCEPEGDSVRAPAAGTGTASCSQATSVEPRWGSST